MTIAETVPMVSDSTEQPAPKQMVLAVEGATCANCIQRIETAAAAIPGVAAARFNLTTKRLALDLNAPDTALSGVVDGLERIGYEARPYEADTVELAALRHEKRLLRALAVAGFGAANVMLLSVSTWSGANGGMVSETRELFHWISALIALPVVAYAGQPFFESAAAALRRRHLNMDVPISIAVLLALMMSVYQTATGEQDAYFDSAVMLLFFLLIGRVLELRSRQRMRDVGQNLLALQRPCVTKLSANGQSRQVAVSDIRSGDRVLVAPGSRIGVDGRVVAGSSSLDDSLITGESAPRSVARNDRVFAGTLNLSGALTIEATSAGADTLLSEIGDLLERASTERGRYRQLADRAAALYAPLVHGLAALTLLGWLALGAGWQPSLLAAITVLIITCPCALGLAVPTVQAVATAGLFRNGILVNSGDALERLAAIDTVVFDKTGTLTEPEPRILNIDDVPTEALAAAARLAQSSRHVLARALAREIPEARAIDGAREIPGVGVVAWEAGIQHRLGSRAHCGVERDEQPSDGSALELWYARQGGEPMRFLFDQRIKHDADKLVAALADSGLDLRVLSGDRKGAVREAARRLGIAQWSAAVDPKQKIERIAALRKDGRDVLMVGDGLNDAAALQAANVSAAPASALEITQSVADIVIIGNRLEPLQIAHETGRKARRLMLQNFALAGLYNAIAIPLAVAGLVTPLMAALFMSGSSIVVTLNALRAARPQKGR